MATPTQPSGFLTTPGYKLYARGLNVQSVKRFRGLNTFKALSAVSPDWAIDLLNVIVAGNGMLSKMRVPLSPIIPAPNLGAPVNAFWDFQQGNGTRQVLTQSGAAFFYLTQNLTVNTAVNGDGNAGNSGLWNFVEANNVLFGTNNSVSRQRKWTGANWQKWGIAAPNDTPSDTAGAGNFSYAYAYQNNVKPHTGNISGVLSGKARGGTLTPNVGTGDTQVDALSWFRTLNGGGDLFHLADVRISDGFIRVPGSSNFVAGPVTGLTGLVGGGITDGGAGDTDTNVDQTILGPLLNNLPPTDGQYLVVVQGRIFIAGMLSASSDIVYSGYEQILLGAPEESFPVNNRIRLKLGAESVVGLGAIHNGLVAFSNTGRMWSLRGAIEDISLNAPVAFSERLEELPWGLGCLSHFTIQSTPYGLVWLAGDKTVQFWDGYNPPNDISVNVYPLLRNITPGTENQCVGAYFNWLERDWYSLTCCTNGAQSPNTIIFFALAQDTGEIEIFVSNIATPFIGAITSSTLQRQLIVASGNYVQILPVQATDVSGLSNDYTTYPPQLGPNNQLTAYWTSGYFGNEEAARSRMWRWATVIPDGSPTGYSVTARYVDNEGRQFLVPQIVGPTALKKQRIGLNQRSQRCSVSIQFPPQDGPMNVLELQVAQIGTSDR